MTMHDDIRPTLSLVRLAHGEGLDLPSYESTGAAGMDLRAALAEGEPLVLNPGARTLVPTGFLFEIPLGFEGQVRPRSGLAFKNGVTCLNTPGTIDSDYRGEVKVLLINHGPDDFTITRGMRIAQMVIAPVTRVSIVEAACTSDTTRGAGGLRLHGPMKKTSDTTGLTLRQDYFDDPAGWRAIGVLLGQVFGVDISPLDRLGGHDRSNLPSAYFDADGNCIANLSAFSMPLIIDGKAVRAAGWQSGAVLPAYRGRGLFRDLIRITLERCDAAGFEASVLYTDKPRLYLPYGFVSLPQHSFAGAPPSAAAKTPVARPLTIEAAADLVLIREALANRAPVSARFAVLDQRLMFMLNAYLVDDVRLNWFETHRCVVAWRMAADGQFELLDIAGPVIPTLADILAGLNLVPDRVTVHFPPDRLDWQATAEPDDGDLVFMMRGPEALRPAGPGCLSPMAEF